MPDYTTLPDSFLLVSREQHEVLRHDSQHSAAKPLAEMQRRLDHLQALDELAELDALRPTRGLAASIARFTNRSKRRK